MLHAAPVNQSLDNRPINQRLELDRSMASSSSGQEKDFDVYVCCSMDDQDDVEQELIEPLRAAQLKVTWEKGFLGGVDLVAARNHAIENSRHTIVVLTESWCRSPAAIDDALSLRFTDPGATDRKILPVRWGKCEPPKALRLDRLKAYDFLDVSQRQSSLSKLLEDLGTSQQAVNEVRSEFAQQGFRALVDLMATPEIRVAVQSVEDAFTTALIEMKELTRCKTAHEFFHAANEQFLLFRENKELLVKLLQTPQENRDEDYESLLDEKWTKLETIIYRHLSPAIDGLITFAKVDEFRPDQLRWSPQIEAALAELAGAAERKDQKVLNTSSERLRHIFGIWPSRFNQQLLEAAKRLHLTKMVEGLERIRQVASQLQFQKDVADRLVIFTRGSLALSELGLALQNSVASHNCLQAIDDILQLLEHPCTCEEDVEKILLAWQELNPPIVELLKILNIDWREKFQSAVDVFKQSVEVSTPDSVNLKTFNRAFGKFYCAVSNTFTQADLALLKLCDKLQKVGVELATAIRNLTHE